MQLQTEKSNPHDCPVCGNIFALVSREMVRIKKPVAVATYVNLTKFRLMPNLTEPRLDLTNQMQLISQFVEIYLRKFLVKWLGSRSVWRWQHM